VDVFVHYSRRYKQGLLLVLFLLVQVEYLLDSIRTVVGSDLLINVLFLIEGAMNYLSD
jgi:hypothetical protein